MRSFCSKETTQWQLNLLTKRPHRLRFKKLHRTLPFLVVSEQKMTIRTAIKIYIPCQMLSTCCFFSFLEPLSRISSLFIIRQEGTPI